VGWRTGSHESGSDSLNEHRGSRIRRPTLPFSGRNQPLRGSEEARSSFRTLPVFLRGGENYQRLEPDFIIIRDGVFAVVEVDGDTFHPETPSAARSRLTLLEDAGAYIIRVNANSCRTMESAEACADGILRDIATYKNNTR
jgi:hypothetical protein